MLKILKKKFAKRDDYLALAKLIEEGKIKCNNVYHQEDGDIRYWGLDINSNELLEKLSNLAKELYFKQIGTAPVSVVGMYNTIEQSRSPNGSGGGWHRDSVHAQFKLFVLLSDVTEIANGAFVVYPQTSRLWFKVLALPLALLGIKRRYNKYLVRPLDWLGFEKKYFIGEVGSTAFCDTSAIHRGSPIKTGCRQMLTFYLFQEVPGHMKL